MNAPLPEPPRKGPEPEFIKYDRIGPSKPVFAPQGTHPSELRGRIPYDPRRDPEDHDYDPLWARGAIVPVFKPDKKKKILPPGAVPRPPPMKVYVHYRGEMAMKV